MEASIETGILTSRWGGGGYSTLWLGTYQIPYSLHGETLAYSVLPDFPLKKGVWLSLSSACSLLIQFKTVTEKTSPSEEKKENYNNGKKDSRYRHMNNASMASLTSTLNMSLFRGVLYVTGQ